MIQYRLFGVYYRVNLNYVIPWSIICLIPVAIVITTMAMSSKSVAAEQSKTTSQSVQPTSTSILQKSSIQSRQYSDLDCQVCHQIDQPLFSHPVNITPRMSVPEDFPLNDGQITCTTCHKNDSTSHASSRQEHDGYLRMGTPGSAFCMQCHTDAASFESQMHAGFLSKAHIQGFSRSRPSLSSKSNRSQINLEIRQCISCHDGSLGNDIGSSHPVAINYQSIKINQRNSRSSLTPVSKLDNRVRLFDGQVGCGSCHSLYSTIPGKLVMKNDRDQLCLSCHRF